MPLTSRAVSIRCRARRTAQPEDARAATEHWLTVSIRCRARRTAQPGHEGGRHRLRQRFYSLSCETYSATFVFAYQADALTAVSIRCRARRTAQPYPAAQAPDQHERCPFARVPLPIPSEPNADAGLPHVRPGRGPAQTSGVRQARLPGGPKARRTDQCTRAWADRPVRRIP